MSGRVRAGPGRGGLAEKCLTFCCCTAVMTALIAAGYGTVIECAYNNEQWTNATDFRKHLHRHHGCPDTEMTYDIWDALVKQHACRCRAHDDV